MSAAVLRDKIAAKIKNLPSAGAVYSNGDTDPDIAPWPSELLDNVVHALVGRGPSGRTGGTGSQFVHRGIDVEWRLSGLDRAEAERVMDALEDEILTEFSSGLTLGGSAIDCIYDGSERPTEFDDADGRPWVSWITRFSARERFAIEMSP